MNVDENQDCRWGLACVTASPDILDGTCQALRLEGETCSDTYECQNYNCGSPDYPGICVNRYWSPWVPAPWRHLYENVADSWGAFWGDGPDDSSD